MKAFLSLPMATVAIFILCLLQDTRASRKGMATTKSNSIMDTVTGECSIEGGIDYYGADIRNLPVLNRRQCCKACHLQEGCYVWSYDGNSSICYLKRSSGWSRRRKPASSKYSSGKIVGTKSPPKAPASPKSTPTPTPTPTPAAPVPVGGAQGGMLMLRGNVAEEAMMTIYSSNDNTPCGSIAKAAYWRPDIQLTPFISVAAPSRLFDQSDLRSRRTAVPSSLRGLKFGDLLYISHLDGRMVPGRNGGMVRHNGIVRVDDICGDDHNQNYCFQGGVGGKVKVDLFIGNWRDSGAHGVGCNGPWGSGLDAITVRRAMAGEKLGQYGGRALPSPGIKCNDCAAARREKPTCWHYTPPQVNYCPALVSQGLANP